MQTKELRLERLGGLTKSEFAEKHIQAVHFFYHRYRKSHPHFFFEDPDDMMSICYMAHMLAIDTYEPSKGSYTNYLNCVMFTRLRRHHEKNVLAQCRNINQYGSPVSFDKVYGSDDECYTLQEKVKAPLTSDEIQIFMLDLPFLLEKLPIQQYNILYDTVILGLKQKQIMKKYNVSQAQVSRLLIIARERLRKEYKYYA